MKCTACKKRTSEYYVPTKKVIIMLCAPCMIAHWQRDPDLILYSKDIDERLEKGKKS